MKELKKKGAWFMVDNVLVDVAGKHIGCVPLCIYLSLKRHANQDNQAWPSYKLIAKELNLSERTISRNIEILVKYGLVDRTKIKFSGQWAKYVYLIKDRELWYFDYTPTIKKLFGSEEIIDHKTKTTSLYDFNNSSHTSESLIKNTNLKKQKKEDQDFFSGEELTDEGRRRKLQEAKKNFYSNFNKKEL